MRGRERVCDMGIWRVRCGVERAKEVGEGTGGGEERVKRKYFSLDRFYTGFWVALENLGDLSGWAGSAYL